MGHDAAPRGVEQALLQPLELLKSTLHSRRKGTPFHEEGKGWHLAKMVTLDRSQVLVSMVAVEQGNRNPVPYLTLMEALGGLGANRRRYPNDCEETLQRLWQRQRTDLVPPLSGQEVQYLQVLFDPLSD